jgi:hypothetical protein
MVESANGGSRWPSRSRQDPCLLARVDHHRVRAGEGGRPAEQRHLDAERLQAEVEPERVQQRLAPGARHQHHHRRPHAPARGLDAGDAPALGQDAGDLAAGLHRDAQAPGGGREGERGGVGIGVPRARLVGGRADVVGAELGEDRARLVRRDFSSVDAQSLLTSQVPAQGRLVAGRHQLQEAGGLEAAIAPHHVGEVAEDLQAFQRQARLVLVGVVHAHQRPRLAGGAGGQVATLEELDVPGAHAGEMERGAGAVGSAADDDDVRRGVHGRGFWHVCRVLTSP